MTARRFGIFAALLSLAAAGVATAAEEAGSREEKEAAGRAGEASISASDSGPTIEASELSKAPKLTRPAKVTYPPEAVGKVSGEVVVALLVDLDEKGEVTGATVVEPKTPTGLGFEEAAVTAAYSLGFEPAELAGKPARVQINYIFKFPLPKPPAPPPVVAPVRVPVEAPKPAPVENFTGVLLERGTRLPMSGILVTVYRSGGAEPIGFEAITDAKGNFHFFDLQPGTWKVFIEPPSYYPFRTTEEIYAGEATHATYYVEKGSYNPFDKMVTAERERKEVSRTVIESAVIDKMPGAMGDPLAVIQNFAGVARSPAGTGEVIVRGSAPQDTQFFVDGAAVPLIYHFGGSIRSVLPVGMIDSLEFYPGNFSPYYGRATGGIVDITTKKLKPSKAGGYFDVNLLDSGIYLETPIGDKAAVAASIRRSYIDWLFDKAIPSNAPITDVTLPRYYDYQLLANYRPAPAHDLRLFVFGSDDAFHIVFRNVARAGTELAGNQISFATRFFRALATYRYVPSDKFENTLRLSQGRDGGDIQIFQFYSHYTIDLTHLRNTSRYEWSKKIALTAGLDLGYYRFSDSVYMPSAPQEGQEDESSTTDTHQTNQSGTNVFLPGAFVELELRPLPGLLILPGLRFDYYSDISQATFAPRFTARYQLSKPVAIKAGVGLFYQEPDPYTGQLDKNFGNPDLKAERAIHYSAGVEWKPREHINLDLTGFYKDLSNWISTTTAIRSDGTPLRFDNNGAGRAYGLEVVARHELTSKFTGWLAYTLSRATRRDSGNTSYRLFEYDQTHILTLFGTYQLPRNWQIGSRFRLVSGDPTTPVTGAVYNASTDRYSPLYGAKYSDRLPPFIQFDVRVDKRWIFNRWMLNAYLDLQNALNHANPEAIQYNYDITKSRVREGIPIFPIIGLRGEF